MQLKKKGDDMIKKRLIKLLSNSKKHIYDQVLWQWLSLLCQMLLVFVAAGLVESAFYNELEERRLMGSMAIILAAILGRYVCSRQATYASFRASSKVKLVLRDRIYEKLLRLGAAYRESVATSEIVQVAAEGVEQLETYFGRYLPQLIYGMLAPLTLFGFLSFINFKASLVLLLCIPLIPVSIVFVQKFAKRLLKKYWGIYTELGDSFLENLQGLTTLKIYQADKEKADRMDEEAERFRRVTMKVLTMQLNSTSVMDIMAYGGAAAGMLVALSGYLSGGEGLGDTLMIILLAAEFFLPLRLLGSFFHIAMNGMAASDKIFALLDLPEPEEKSKRLRDGELQIKFEKVNFSYHKEREILKDISIEFPARSFTALVGASGCGKSTIAGILMGRNRNYKGSLLIQEKELSELSEDSLMQNITLVTHNSYLQKGSVRELLLMGRPKASEQELREALEKVNLWEFFQTQQGIDTMVLEKGSNLSGGQCQRLALARALLHDTPVYIFDEATSNIDVESEEMIMEVIKELTKNKTVILISHRLANVVDADRIYMLQEGQVIQAGSHKDLMLQDGGYRELFSFQSNLEKYTKVSDGDSQPQGQIEGRKRVVSEILQTEVRARNDRAILHAKERETEVREAVAE